MKRRNFLKSLMAVPASLFIPGAFREKNADKAKSILLLDSSVAGFQYYKGEELWSRMKAGDGLRLAREPKNPFDYDAVEVYRGRDKIGYIRRTDNSAVAQMMDRGMKLTGKIKRLSRQAEPGDMVGVAVEVIV